MSEKIYVGNGKIRESKYGEFYTLGLKTSELEKYTNDKGYVNIVVNRRKSEDKFGNNLAISINDYKKEEQTEAKKQDEISISDIPF